MRQIDIAQVAVLTALLEYEGISIGANDLESGKVRQTISKLLDKINTLRTKLDPKNALTRRQFVKLTLKKYKFRKKQKLFLLALANKKGVARDKLIKKTKTKNFNNLKTLKSETQTYLKKHDLYLIFNIKPMHKPKPGYKLEINSNLLNFTLK